MKFTEESVKTSDGIRLHVKNYAPDGRKKGVVHVLHGMSEHSGRYDEFATHLAEQGYSVYLQDHRRHGRSLDEDGSLGVFTKHDRFERLVDDIGDVQKYITQHENSKNVTILGHSMGSILLRRYLQKDPKHVKRAIVMGTLPRSHIVAPLMAGLAYFTGWFMPSAARHRLMNWLMSRSVNRKLPNAKGKYDWLALNPEVIQAYQEDDLSGFIYNKYFYREFFKGVFKVSLSKNIEKTANIPVLFISGASDPLVKKEMKGIEKLAQTYERKIKGFWGEVKPIYYARHEILNEKNRAYVYDYLVKWIKDN